MRILLAVEPADFRKGIDGLAPRCRQRLKADPWSGAMFVFSNKRRKALKILVYDGQGFWLCQKRLSQGRFPGWPPATDSTKLCLAWNWVQANGHPRDMVCRGLLLGLPRAGLIELPAPRFVPPNPLAVRAQPQPMLICPGITWSAR